MIQKELSIDAMLPRVLMVRQFDSAAALWQNKRARVARHYELGYYTSSHGGSLAVEGRDFQIRPGDIRFAMPGYKLNSQPDYQCITVYFDFGEEDVRYENQILDGLPAYISTDGALRPLFEELLHSYGSGQVHAGLQQKAVLMQILAELFALAHSRKQYCQPVQQCMEYMQRQFSQDVTLQTLGQLTGYSGLHLLRLFERDTGQTPHKWLTAIRINQAKHLLTDTQLTLEEIAVQCGFRSIPYFKSLFHQCTGSTPGKYRKNARNG